MSQGKETYVGTWDLYGSVRRLRISWTSDFPDQGYPVSGKFLRIKIRIPSMEAVPNMEYIQVHVKPQSRSGHPGPGHFPDSSQMPDSGCNNGTSLLKSTHLKKPAKRKAHTTINIWNSINHVTACKISHTKNLCFSFLTLLHACYSFSGCLTKWFWEGRSNRQWRVNVITYKWNWVGSILYDDIVVKWYRHTSLKFPPKKHHFLGS